MRWRSNLISARLRDPFAMYPQLEKVLNDFVEHTTKIKGSSLQSVSPRWESYSKQFVIIQKAKELLGLLKDKDWKSNSSLEVEPNNSKYVTSKETSFSDHSRVDMSLTLVDAAHKLDNADDLDATIYLSDMEITCLESSFFKTPTATVRSILKNTQTQRSASGRRRVRFEDELEETLAEIIENKENFDWGPVETVVEANCRSDMKPNSNYKVSVITPSCRSVSRGKTIETLKILSKHDLPRKSWSIGREETVNLNALRDIKTLVEIDNERRQNSMQDRNKYSEESILTPGRFVANGEQFEIVFDS